MAAIKVSNLYPKPSNDGSSAPGRSLTITGATPIAFSSISKTAATLATNFGIPNQNVLFTAVTAGSDGNNIRIEFIDPKANSQTLRVEVSNQEQITIYLGTGSTGAITSTAANIVTAVNAKAAAAALVTPTVYTAAATGSITAVATAAFTDGQTFTLNDGVNPAVVFEIDKTGDGVTSPNVQVDISAVTTAIDVAGVIATAINGAASLAITATDNLAGKVNLVNDANGALGNQTITTTSPMTVTGMSGGTTGTGLVGVLIRTHLAGGEDVFRRSSSYVELSITGADVYVTYDGTTPTNTGNGIILKNPTVVTWSIGKAVAAKFLAPSGTAYAYAAQLAD